LIALGVTTATRKGPADSAGAAGVAVAQAVLNIATITKNITSFPNLFIFPPEKLNYIRGISPGFHNFIPTVRMFWIKQTVDVHAGQKSPAQQSSVYKGS
jgi:hypothetical protein